MIPFPIKTGRILLTQTGNVAALGVKMALLALALGLAAFAARVGDCAEQDEAGIEFFEKRIRPVLVKHCYECHSAGAKTLRGGLHLDHREAVLQGGDSGPAVAPGNVEESLLIGAIRYESFEMPPTGKLPDSVIADFVRWVEMGAPDPRVGKAPTTRPTIDIQKQREFWSFQPIQRPPLPPVRDASWPRSDIDRFILARLEQANLPPAGDAQRHTLLRRVYFDLIGLPPPPEAIGAFVADRSPHALEEVVDELLASRHFGERWGRHWLDVARYADSSGGGRTLMFPDAWRYRDYVVEALNADRPFDQFIVEQIAGDLLEGATGEQTARRLTATAFLVLGPTNYELQDKELLRMEVVDEQIDTIGRAFLGMTIGCARCHDHKFDPIPNTDYYALAGIFRSTKTLTPGNVSGFEQRELPVSLDHQKALDEHAARVEPLQKKIELAKAELKKLEKTLGASADAVDPATLAGIVIDNSAAVLSGDWKSSSSVKPFVGGDYQYAGRGAATARFAARIEQPGEYEVRAAHTASGNRATNARFAVRHAQGETARTVNHRLAPDVEGLFVSLGVFQFSPDAPAEVVVSCENADGFVVVDCVQFLPAARSDDAEFAPASDANGGPKAPLRERIADIRSQLQSRESELARMNKTAPPPAPKVMAVRDEQETGDYFVCIRGNVHNLGPQVPRGFLSVAGADKPATISAGQSGRLELARWIASSDNPLTARVVCNRVWHWLLGEGIVRTPDNFGLTGERPSHPELLDYLAARFVDEGWSIKQLVKQIVLSRTYALSSGPPASAAMIDPENRLLSHAHRRRLDAESIRDAMLFASGGLDLAYGGPTVPRDLKSEFDFQFGDSRRSLYTPIFRNTLHEHLQIFDFPDPNLVGGRRNTSTLPSQALYLMNSPFVIDQAQMAARRLLAEVALSDEQRLDLAYWRTLGRPPLPAERELALEYLHAGGEGQVDPYDDRLNAWSGLCQALFGCLDFRYLE